MKDVSKICSAGMYNIPLSIMVITHAKSPAAEYAFNAYRKREKEENMFE